MGIYLKNKVMHLERKSLLECQLKRRVAIANITDRTKNTIYWRNKIHSGRELKYSIWQRFKHGVKEYSEMGCNVINFDPVKAINVIPVSAGFMTKFNLSDPERWK